MGKKREGEAQRESGRGTEREGETQRERERHGERQRHTERGSLSNNFKNGLG